MNRLSRRGPLFAVVVPATILEAVLWRPRRLQRRAAVEHPRPVHRVMDRRDDIADLMVPETLPHRGHAANQ